MTNAAFSFQTSQQCDCVRSQAVSYSFFMHCDKFILTFLCLDKVNYYEIISDTTDVFLKGFSFIKGYLVELSKFLLTGLKKPSLL